MDTSYEETPAVYLATFDQVMRDNPRAPYVTRFSLPEIENLGATPIVCGLTGLLVIAHTSHIEAAGLFNGGTKGMGLELLKFAIREYGVNYVECFAPLDKLYKSIGFAVSSVTPFNPDYAPENWNTETLGTPDYVTLEL